MVRHFSCFYLSCFDGDIVQFNEDYINILRVIEIVNMLEALSSQALQIRSYLTYSQRHNASEANLRFGLLGTIQSHISTSDSLIIWSTIVG